MAAAIMTIWSPDASSAGCAQNPPATQAKRHASSTPQPLRPKSLDTRAGFDKSLSCAAAASKRLRPFGGNSFDDYYDTALADFPAPAKFFKWLAVSVLGLITKIWFRWRWDNDQLFVGDKTPRVLIMNHPTFLDPIVTVVHLLVHGIPVRTIYKSEFNKFKPLQWALSRLGGSQDQEI